MLEEYFIEAPQNKKLDDLQICFLRNASLKYSLRQDQLSEEIDFLKNQYVLVKDKIYKNTEEDESASQATDVYIFNVSTGQIIYDSTKDESREIPFEKIQVSFFIQDHSDEDLQITFIVKCQRMDFEIQITKQGPQIFNERSENYTNYNQHMILPQNLDIHLDRLEENFNQVFFFTKTNCNVNFIYPLHSSKEENISSDIKNKQEEVSKHI